MTDDPPPYYPSSGLGRAYYWDRMVTAYIGRHGPLKGADAFGLEFETACKLAAGSRCGLEDSHWASLAEIFLRPKPARPPTPSSLFPPQARRSR